MKLTGFCVAAAVVLMAAGQAQALPIGAAPIAAASSAIDGGADLIQVRGGCGFGAHQGPMGGCRLNRGPRGRMRGMMGGAPRGCRPGTHPSGRGYCVRNYY